MPSSSVDRPRPGPRRAGVTGGRGAQTSVMSGKRGPSSSALAPEQRRPAGEVEVVADDHQRARPVGRVHAARRVGQDHERRAEAAEQQHRLDDEPGSLPSYRWKRPWSAATGTPAIVPRSSRPTCPGAVAAGQPGSSPNGIGDRVRDLVGQAAQPRAEHEADARDEVGPGADGVDERGQPLGLGGRGDRTGGIDGVGAHRPRIVGGGTRSRCDRRATGQRLSQPPGALNFDARWEY